jgi:hypothetical protein
MRMAVRSAAALAAAALLAGCGHERAAYDVARPASASSASARLVTAEGRGARRLSLWVARNGNGDLCPGWRLGAGRPRAFHCQRRGLERPVLWVEGGGGPNVSWGGDVGLVAPGVSHVTIDQRRVPLRPVDGLDGWRSFATTSGGRPGSDLEAYAGRRQLLEDTGLWIEPAAGHSTYAYVPEQQRGIDARVTALALAEPGVRKVVADHGPAWIDMPIGLQKCSGGTIGESVPIRLWRATTYRATVPFMKLAPSHLNVAYVTGVHRVLAVHSKELLVSVDTTTWRVIGVETAFESGIEIPLGNTREPRPGGGYDDPASCPQGD